MQYSRYFLKTVREAPAGAMAESQKLLHRGGFVRPVSTGRYALLPIGYRVYDKIIKIIIEEMEAIGAQRMELPIMQPIEVWRVTNREAAFGELMSVVDDHYGRTFVLSATGEALMTEIFGSFKPSYKDLPINVYQFMPKFRDELRPRGGLIRVREFLMKDGYNFEKDEASFMKTYRAYWKAYEKIFKRMHLNPVPVIADNGPLGGDYSHEFMQITPEVREPLGLYLDDEEKERDIEIIDVANNPSKYKEIMKIYQRYPEKTLKNLVYRIDDSEFICVTIRGDYKVDFTKLRRLLSYKQIRPATADEIASLDSCIGYVSAISLCSKVRLLVDESALHNKNLWDGAHAEKVFRKNVNVKRDISPKETVDVREDKIFSAGGDKIVMCDRCGYMANVEKAEFVRESVNMDQKLEPFKIVEQPEWVCTMDDNVEHYKKPRSHFLKNVVYRDKKGHLVIAALRGDLDANPVKVANLLGCGELEMADDDDLARIGTKSGWVHSWGHEEKHDDVVYVADVALTMSKNLIGGQKEKTTDSFNVNYGRDFKHAHVGDIAEAYDGAKCAKCKDGYLHEKKSIELGHIFKYDTYYSIPHKATYVDKDGKEKPMYMGAYGIGVGRLMAACVEINHDDKGIKWPSGVAPFQVHIVSVGKAKQVDDISRKLHSQLEDDGYEVLWDERDDVSAGVKFNDADLLGIPLRIVVSEKSLESGTVELKKRGEDKVTNVMLKGNALSEAVARAVGGKN